MSEQEIVTAEELHRYRNDVVFHDLVMRFRGYVDGGLGKFEDIIAAANFGRKIHFANENCDYEAVIRSLPVPSDPSREDGGLLGLLQSLLQEPGSPPPIPTEAMAEFIIRDAASRLEHLENFKATVHSLLDEMGLRKYEGETCRIRRRLASLRTALRELAEVAKDLVDSQWQHRCSDKIGGCTAVSDSKLVGLEDWLTRHSGLLDGELKKENER